MAKKKSSKNSRKTRKNAKALSKTAKARTAKSDESTSGKKWKFGGVVVKTIAGAALFQSYAMGKSY